MTAKWVVGVTVVVIVLAFAGAGAATFGLALSTASSTEGPSGPGSSHLTPDIVCSDMLCLSPTSGPVGTTVTAVGVGWVSGETLTMFFGISSITTSPSTCPADGSGDISCTFQVPLLATGAANPWAVEAYGSSSGFSNTVDFTITPTLTLSPSNGPVGTSVTVSGNGYALGSPIDVSFDGASVTTTPSPCLSDTTGTISSCSFQVPAAPNGAEAVYAVDGYPDVSPTVSFTVDASISLSPTTGPNGAPVTVTGTGFAASSTVTIDFDGSPQSTSPSPCDTDASGSFSCVIDVPTIAVGPYHVYAVDSSSNSAFTSFVVTPSLSLSPTSGPIGTTVTASGSGYVASTGVSFTFGGASISTSCTTNGVGSFSCLFTVPTDPYGSYTVRATDGFDDTATAPFQITTSLDLSPSSGTVGTVVTATGTGFAASSAITMSFDGTAVPAACTLNDGTGTFTCTFTVPGYPNGAHTVEAKDAAGDSATATFTVLAALTSLSPDSGTFDSGATAAGNGFAADSPMSFTLDGASAGTCITDDHGGFTDCGLIIPQAPNGLQTIVAEDLSGNLATLTFTMLASIHSLTPSSGPPGTSVSVFGAGFAATVPVAVFFNGISQTTSPSPCDTNSVGSFTCSFTVPVVPFGAYSVEAEDTGHTAYATFTVTASVTTLSPSSGPVGTVVDASGDGFAASSPISFTFAGIALVTSCSTGSTGAFSACAFTVPPTPHGAETVVAKDGSGNSADATFTVLASLTLSPTSGAVGSWVSASGLGYAASSAITLTFNGVTVASSPSPCDTNSVGSFSCTFQVPANPLGTYTVTAKDASSNSASANYRVTTSLMLSPTSGAVGSTVTATGTGYAASSAITITFNDGVVATSPSSCMTNSAGSFSCTFVVPQAPHGPEVVAAEDASHNVASTFFSVTSTITLSPTSGPGKTIVTVTGTGFAASATITIYFNGDKMTTTPSSCKSNTVGTFTCTFKVPEGKNATHTVEAKDTLGDTATAFFKRT